ncbi:hypothetical protein [Alkaliphilus metalliredigens]|uniref:hypothetical protein n=1 Tax=Alkaliphilus metalliredigens TaxID=208226 RepID=UPI0002EAE131|nr:hypothetical protein [Alkaliphilus metalliredigens]
MKKETAQVNEQLEENNRKKLITLLTGRVQPIVELLTSAQLLVKMMGTNIHLCPHCKKGYMLSQHDLVLAMVDTSYFFTNCMFFFNPPLGRGHYDFFLVIY